MSHEDPKANTIIIKAIAKKGVLVITSGLKQTFISMGIKILGNNNIATVMRSYIQEAIHFFDANVSTTVLSP